MSDPRDKHQHKDIVATLRLWAKNANEQGVTNAVDGLQAAADEIERLRAERDEARMQVCLLAEHIKHGNKYPLSKAMEIAEKLGWDCFEENTE